MTEKKVSKGMNWTRLGNLIYEVEGSEVEVFTSHSLLESLE